MTLASLKTAGGMFSLANFDESEDLIRLLSLRPEEVSTEVLIKDINQILIKEVSSTCSGLVIDPRAGLEALVHKEKTTGVAFRLTEENQTIQALPKLLSQWGVEEVKNNLGVAKLTLPYHPMEDLALDKKKFLHEVFDFCQYEQIDLILDLHITGAGGGKIHPDDLPEAQLQAVQEFRTSCHLMALDYAGSVLSTATLTAELDIPWVLVSRQEGYEEFKLHLREALDNGARGFMIGRPLWLEISQMRKPDMTPDKVAMQKFAATTIRDRLIELTRIADEVAAKQPLDLNI